MIKEQFNSSPFVSTPCAEDSSHIMWWKQTGSIPLRLYLLPVLKICSRIPGLKHLTRKLQPYFNDIDIGGKG